MRIRPKRVFRAGLFCLCLRGISGRRFLRERPFARISHIFKYVAAGDTLKFYLLISNFYLLDAAFGSHLIFMEVSILHALSEIFRCVAADYALKL